LLLRLRGGIPTTIRAEIEVGGKVMYLEVDNEATVADLKDRIREKLLSLDLLEADQEIKLSLKSIQLNFFLLKFPLKFSSFSYRCSVRRHNGNQLKGEGSVRRQFHEIRGLRIDFTENPIGPKGLRYAPKLA
jgi:hypothetical protein